MKRSFLILIFVFACAQFCESLAQLQLPKLSPKSTVTQIIGLSEIAISYSRPNVRERIVWGELVPYGEVWRTGADEATTITFGDSVQINGQKLEAGKYALFTIPGKDEWIVIFNRNSKQWGSFNYDSTKDALRIKVKPETNAHTESLLFTFSDINYNSATVNLEWEKVKVSFDVKMNVDKKAYENIKKAFDDAKKDDWVVYAAAANYAVESKVHLDEAIDWIEKSIQIKSTYYNNFVKAKLMLQKGDKKAAKLAIQKSREEGKNDPEFKYFESTLNKLEKEIL